MELLHPFPRRLTHGSRERRSRPSLRAQAPARAPAEDAAPALPEAWEVVKSSWEDYADSDLEARGGGPVPPDSTFCEPGARCRGHASEWQRPPARATFRQSRTGGARRHRTSACRTPHHVGLR